MTEELRGEVGRIHGVVFTDDDGNPIVPLPHSTCPECKLGKEDGTWWDAHRFGPQGSITRWHCPNGHTWVN